MQKIRVRLSNGREGFFLGMLVDERGDPQAIVQLDNAGMMLYSCHPSKVETIPFEEKK